MKLLQQGPSHHTTPTEAGQYELYAYRGRCKRTLLEKLRTFSSHSPIFSILDRSVVESLLRHVQSGDLGGKPVSFNFAEHGCT